MKIENPKLTAKNPHFGNRYAPLDEVLRVLEPLKEAGFDTRQTCQLSPDGGPVLFVTELLDATKETINRVAFPFPSTNKAQELGSALTYCRRYGLLLLFNLVGEEDDDGNAATPRTKAKKSTGTKPAGTKTGLKKVSKF